MESKSRRFAMILQAIENAETEMANFRKDHAARMDTLRGELRALKMEELTGQMSLPDLLEKHLPKIERELNKDSSDNKVTLGVSGD